MSPARFICALTLLWAGASAANMAAVQLHPATVQGPELLEATRLEVESETLEFDCGPRAGTPVCHFEASYHLSNLSTQAQSVVGAFYGERVETLSIASAGTDLGTALSPEQLQALDGAAGLRRTEDPQRFGFALTVPAGGRSVLRAAGTLVPGERFIPHGYAADAAEGRHLVLGRVGRARAWDLRYFLSPIRSWQGAPRIEVTVRGHASDRMSLGDGWQCEGAAGETTCRRTWEAGSEPPELDIAFAREAPVFALGGLLAGVGGATGSQGGFRARLGYEATARGWLLGAAAVETDFQHRLQAALTLEAATPNLLVIPSFGLGVGTALEVRPESRAALRIQGTVMLYPAGLFCAVDVYPSTPASGAFTEVTVMLQGGL